MQLKIHVNIDRWLLYFSFFELLFLRWVLIGQDTIIYIYCTVMVLRLLFLSRSTKRKYLNNFYLFILLFLYILIRSLFASSVRWSILGKNLITLILPLIVILYFGYLITAKPSIVRDTFLKLTNVLNVYYIINTIIILIQRNVKFFLMPVDRITNSYYPDHLAGLLGIEGTHRLALFTTFLLLLNLYKIDIENHKQSKKLLGYVVIAVIIATAFFTSAMNDNNMMYVLIPVFLLLYYMADSKNSRGKLFKVAVGGVAAIIGVYVLVNTPILAAVGDIRIVNILKNTFQGIQSGVHTDERLTHLLYALVQNGGALFGVGFATLTFRQDASITNVGYIYRNFGMNDIAPLVSLGGTVFYVLYMWAIAKIIAPFKDQRRTRKYIFVLVLILTYYHQVLSSVTMTIPMCWIFCLFVMRCAKAKESVVTA